MASSGNKLSKIITLLGTATVVFVAVTWFLPKIEKHQGQVFGHSVADLYPPQHHTVASSPAAVHQSMGGIRDFNLAGLAIENVADYAVGSGVTLSGI